MPDAITFRRAVMNVARRGDTDVFPYPFENSLFFDKPDEAGAILEKMSASFETAKQDNPIVSFSTLANVSYGGFRWVTQIDPIWNAYLLAAVLSSAHHLEAARIPSERNVVFSYRFDAQGPDDRLFVDEAWRRFQEHSRSEAARAVQVVALDIADFYSRIYHHRVENALIEVGYDHRTTKQIIDILSAISNNASYGLPVGGPAARLLSELVLNRSDRLVDSAPNVGWFARYADDYRVFAPNVADAHRSVGFIAETLLRNEGLTLQKAKTRIMTPEEYIGTLDPGDPPQGTVGDFMRIQIHFDPYSPTRDEDYEVIKAQLDRFDILDLLGSELRKGRIHSSVTKRLLSALALLDSITKEQAVLSLIENFEVLTPVMPQVLLAIRSALADRSADFVSRVHEQVVSAFEEHPQIASVDLNVAYLIRLLADRRSELNERTLSRLYNAPHGFTGQSSPIINRDIVVAMANWRASYWLSNLKNSGNINVAHPWVRRAFCVAAPTLDDEGQFWFKANSRGLSDLDKLSYNWALEKLSDSAAWKVPM